MPLTLNAEEFLAKAKLELQQIITEITPQAYLLSSQRLTTYLEYMHTSLNFYQNNDLPKAVVPSVGHAKTVTDTPAATMTTLEVTDPVIGTPETKTESVATDSIANQKYYTIREAMVFLPKTKSIGQLRNQVAYLQKAKLCPIKQAKVGHYLNNLLDADNIHDLQEIVTYQAKHRLTWRASANAYFESREQPPAATTKTIGHPLTEVVTLLTGDYRGFNALSSNWLPYLKSRLATPFTRDNFDRYVFTDAEITLFQQAIDYHTAKHTSWPKALDHAFGSRYQAKFQPTAASKSGVKIADPPTVETAAIDELPSFVLPLVTNKITPGTKQPKRKRLAEIPKAIQIQRKLSGAMVGEHYIRESQVRNTNLHDGDWVIVDPAATGRNEFNIRVVKRAPKNYPSEISLFKHGLIEFDADQNYYIVAKNKANQLIAPDDPTQRYFINPTELKEYGLKQGDEVDIAYYGPDFLHSEAARVVWRYPKFNDKKNLPLPIATVRQFAD